MTAEDAAGNIGRASNEAPLGRRHHAADGARNADRDWRCRTRDALMGCGDGQRGRRPLRRPPRHDAGFTPATANRIAQPTGTGYTDNTTAGTYFYKVTAEDNAGNVGPAGTRRARR